MAVIVVINSFRFTTRFNNYVKLENRISIINIYKYYLSVFSIIGLSLRPGETALQFAYQPDLAYYGLSAMVRWHGHIHQTANPDQVHFIPGIFLLNCIYYSRRIFYKFS